MDNAVKISIEGEGLSLTKMTTLHKAGQIISFLGVDQTIEPSAHNNSATVQTLLGPKRAQPREAIVSSAAKTYPQKIAALAMHLRDEMGQESFTPQEIKSMLKKMGDEPRNFTRDLNVAVELKYIISTDAAADLYELTDKGADAVEAKFLGATNKKSAGLKRVALSNGVREEVKAFDVNATLDGFPDYHKLPTKADKILWLMAYAEKNSVNALSPSEIDFLSGELRDRVESRGFTALNQRNIKNGFVSKTSAGFQIQRKGTEHLTSLKQAEAPKTA